MDDFFHGQLDQLGRVRHAGENEARSWICLASLAFDSSSSGDSSPRSRKTFPEPSDSGSYDGCASLMGFVILLLTLSAVFRGC